MAVVCSIMEKQSFLFIIPHIYLCYGGLKKPFPCPSLSYDFLKNSHTYIQTNVHTSQTSEHIHGHVRVYVAGIKRLPARVY